MKRFEVVRVKETVRIVRAKSEADIIDKYGYTNDSGWHIARITELEDSPND